MNLSSDLISRFVKATKDEKKTKGESTVYGTTVEANGSMYVRIDGANTLTPVTATTDVVAGERVIVMIKNHTATITGNITSPAARVSDTTNLGEAAINAAEVALAAAVQATEAANKATNAERVATNFIEHDGNTGDVLIGNKVSGAFAGFKARLTGSLYAILNVQNSALLSVSDTLITIGNKNTNVTIKDVGFGNTDISDLGDGTITGAILAASQTGSGEGGSGKDGVGIESIKQTTKSTEDDGTNIITATLTNGTKSTFEIQNGSKGSKGDKGDKGDTGIGIQSVEQTTISSEPGGTNVVTLTLTDGSKKTFSVKNGLGTAKVIEISSADYEALSDADKNAEDKVYFIPDGEADGSGNSSGMMRSVKRKAVSLSNVEMNISSSGGVYYGQITSASTLFGVDPDDVLSVTFYDWTKVAANFSFSYDNTKDVLYLLSDTSQTVDEVVLNIVYLSTEYVGGDSVEVGNTDISGIGDGTVTGAIGALNTGVNELNSKTSPNFRALHNYSDYEFVPDAITEVANKLFKDESLSLTFGVISGTFIGGYPFTGTYYNRGFDCIVEFNTYIYGHSSYSVNADSVRKN